MKKILLYLILLMAITMAGVVAYVSVTGLLKVFTGAGTLGLMLFTTIEIAKVVATMAIHTYSKTIGWLYNILLSLFIGIAMLITSMGIYGFLSSSYKDSFAQMESINFKVELLTEKKINFDEELTTYRLERTSLNETIGELTKGLSNNVIQYKDRETGQIITTTSSTTRKALEKQLENANKRIVAVNSKVDSLSNLAFELESEILETKLGNEAAVELSSLQYLADVTGQSMDDVMKWFILLLIIIGDPMAVIMVIVFSKVINQKKPNEPKNGDKIKIKRDNGSTINNDEYFESLDKYEGLKKKIKNETISDLEPIGDISVKEKVVNDTPTNEQEPLKNGDKLTGRIKREDIKEIKQQGSRGYSVDVPEPNSVTKIGTNKEIRDEKPRTVYFNRPNK